MLISQHQDFSCLDWPMGAVKDIVKEQYYTYDYNTSGIMQETKMGMPVSVSGKMSILIDYKALNGQDEYILG